MNQDKKTLYLISALYICALLLACLVPNDAVSNILFASLCAVFAAIVFFKVKKRAIHGIEWRQVAMVVAALAIIALMIYYLTGLRFGFVKVLLIPSFIWKYIIPYAVIIISSELIRSVLLDQKNKPVSVLFYFVFVLLDAAFLSASGALGSFSKFTDLVALIIFPAFTANLLCHFLSGKYGMLPSTVYKLIILLYPYIIPIRPDMSDAMLGFLRVLLPIGVLLIISGMYAKRKNVASRHSLWIKSTAAALCVVILTGFIMLISCQFRYGLLVIGSGSMSGELEKGDAIIYEQYNGQKIQNGQVIIFEKNNTTVIHRVVDIKKINGVTRYYTKGDANDSADSGYITADAIVGTTTLKVKYIGYPTLWVRSLFK